MSSSLLALLATVLSSCATPLTQSASTPQRIAFGSCYASDGPSEIWSTIADYDPDLFVLLGDNVYADTEDMDVMRHKYAELDAVEAFARVRKSATLLATWDDHDYGANDVGAEYPMRREAQQVFLDFLKVPKDDARRQREGIYSAHLFGPVGKRVQVLLLDTRYHRGELKRAPNPWPLSAGRRGAYVPNDDPQVTVLGERQWKWLEEELAKPAEIRILASSIQVVAEDHRFERWMNFPRERRRLFETIKRTKAGGVIAVSGDRHMAEVSVLDPERAEPGSAVDVGYPFIDVTASSLNRPSTWRNEVNRHRVGSAYFAVNFGTLEVDWASGAIVLAIRSKSGEEVIRFETTLAALQHP